MNKNDLRVIKTNQNIRSTFIQLLSEKEFDKITVQELISRARINRSTFYKHYQDKYDLAESIAKDWMEEYRNILEQRIAALNPDDQLLSVDKLHEILEDHRNTILALWKIRTEHIHIFDDMQCLLKNIAHKIFIKATGKEMSDYQAHLLSVIMITNLRFLLENKDVYTKDILLTELNPLIKFLSDMGIHR